MKLPATRTVRYPIALSQHIVGDQRLINASNVSMLFVPLLDDVSMIVHHSMSVQCTSSRHVQKSVHLFQVFQQAVPAQDSSPVSLYLTVNSHTVFRSVQACVFVMLLQVLVVKLYSGAAKTCYHQLQLKWNVILKLKLTCIASVVKQCTGDLYQCC